MSKISPRRSWSNFVRALGTVYFSVKLSLFHGRSYKTLSGRRDGVTVSLTSYPGRIPFVWKTLDSLFRQTRVPDRILLILTEEEFPDRKLPESLDRFIAAGVEVIFLPYNLRCHNKYHHILQNSEGARVITVDDDSYFRRDLVARLVGLSDRYPDAVCANIAKVIRPEFFHDYAHWRRTNRECAPCHGIIALGFGGVLYPPTFHPQLLFDVDRISRLAPTTDDLWLKAVEVRSGVKVACGGFYPRPITLPNTQKVSLRSTNVKGSHRNDSQWAALDKEFSLKGIICAGDTQTQ